MWLHGKLTAVLCALVLALSLSACGGGSGIATLSIDTAEDQRKAISSAIQAARDEVGALGDDATEAELAAAADAIETARKAVSDADALTASERRAHASTVSLLEENLASAKTRIASARNLRRQEMAMEARRLTAAFAAPRITDIDAMVGRDTPPVMSGTVPGTPATAVSGLETLAPSDASTANGWQRGLYTVPDEAGALVDTVVLYSNIEAPGARPFSGEGGKYATGNGLDAEGNLPIDANTDATLIVSASFPTGPGIRTHDADAAGDAQVTGSFDGAPGTYVCTPAIDNDCRSSIKHGGGIELTGGGGWKFVPAEGAMVPTPDGEYQYFGWWLRDTNGSYAVGLFHRGTGGATDEFTDLPALQGTATYTGPAAGLFAITPQPGDASAGGFTATVTLEADFGDGTDLGTVEGSVDDFMVNGQAKDWSVEMQAARIDTDGAITPGSTDTALTYWTIGDTKAQTTATWSGQFHDVDDDRTPVVATGRFEAVHGNVGRMIGAFGATRR